MKLKSQPDDFLVEELTDVVAGDVGSFAFYRLEKSGWSTPDALAAVRRRWQIDLRRLSYGGLKGRHARTVQYLSIHNGPKRDLTHHTVTLTYLGQITSPYTSNEIRANRFRVVLRGLSVQRREQNEARIASTAAQGVPNYFDDQRFGSVSGPGSEFIAAHLVRGDFEGALKLALTAPYEHDRAEQKREKQTLRQHWGEWDRLKAELPRSHARSLVDYLRQHPGDFRGTVARLRPELRGLYLSAYQSHLWNRVLARWLQTHVPQEALHPVKLRLGAVPFHHELPPDAFATFSSLMLPLPTSRWKPEPDDDRLALVESVLAEEGISLREMQIKGVRELFFSRGDRPALCLPYNLTHEWGEDERNRGKLSLTLSFDLPRGSYATLIVKAVTS
jgi:tRNA pseudouridine13 synthase